MYKMSSNLHLHITSKVGIQTEGTRRVHVNTASKQEKEGFKKEQERYYWIFSKNKMDSL